MARPRHLRRRRIPSLGIWLAFAAIAIQLLIPLFVSEALALESAPIHSANICTAASLAPAPGHDTGGHHFEHCLAGGCLICNALAAGHLFAPPAQLAPPLPRAEATVLFRTAPHKRASGFGAASYESRAPPSIG